MTDLEVARKLADMQRRLRRAEERVDHLTRLLHKKATRRADGVGEGWDYSNQLGTLCRSPLKEEKD